MRNKVKLFGRQFRPFRFWIPEVLNRLCFPGWILRKSRRDEVAIVLQQARKDGIKLHRGCLIYGPSIQRTLARAPKKRNQVMTSTKTIRALHAANQRNQATIKTLEKRIAELEEWIKAEGEHNDTCTYSILKRVCDGCRCERREKK